MKSQINPSHMRGAMVTLACLLLTAAVPAQMLRQVQGSRATPTPVATAGRERLAVVDFRVIGREIPADMGAAIAENLLGEFGTSRYDLVERSMLERLLA